MASLQNLQIDQSYQGLIKTADNTSTAPFPPVALQYGDGTDLPIKLGYTTNAGLGDMILIQSGTKFLEVHSQGVSLGGLSTLDAQTGTASIVNGTFNFGSPSPAITTNVDFTNATVTGLPGGSPGLVNGTGVSGVPSLKVADSLVTNPATASAGGGIAIGDNANSGGADNFARNNIAIGTDSQATDEQGVALGFNARATGPRSTAVGLSALASANKGVAIGSGANTNQQESVALGADASVSGSRSIAIGRNASATGINSVALGNFAKTTGGRSISIASCAGDIQTNAGLDTIAIIPGGFGTTVTSLAARSITLGGADSQLTRTNNPETVVIGHNASATADNAVALGADVVAAKASTVSVVELETQLAGGGITMKSPNGTEYKLTVSDAGALVIT